MPTKRWRQLGTMLAGTLVVTALMPMPRAMADEFAPGRPLNVVEGPGARPADLRELVKHGVNVTYETKVSDDGLQKEIIKVSTPFMVYKVTGWSELSAPLENEWPVGNWRNEAYTAYRSEWRTAVGYRWDIVPYTAWYLAWVPHYYTYARWAAWEPVDWDWSGKHGWHWIF